MDQHPSTTPLILEKAAEQAGAFFRGNRVAFLSSLFFGLLAYGFALTNKLVNHDEVQCLFAKGGTVTSGRWGLGALDAVFPNYSMPWIYGLLTIFFVALAVCILVNMFSVRNRLLQVLLAGCVMVFPSLIGLFGYMFTSCCFALSFLLAVLSAALVQWGRKRFILPAAACLVFSLSIYQSYISVAAGLLVLVLIRRLLTGSDPLSVVKQGVFCVGFLVASLVAYYLCTQVVFRITGTELNSYASGYFIFTPSVIFQGAVLAYRNFFRFFTQGLCGLIPTAFSRLLHMLALGITLILLPGLCRARKLPAAAILLLAGLILVLPLAVNCMYMITAEESVHTLVLYGFVSVYIGILMVADLALEQQKARAVRRLALNTVTGLLALVILINTYLANQSFLHLYLRYENAYAFYTTLASDIRTRPDFTEKTTLALVGSYQQPEYYTEQFRHVHSVTGAYGFVPDDYSRQRFLEYYLGFSIPFASGDRIDEIRQLPEFAQMPVYPYYGSVRSFGDVLVVKLS